MANNKVKVEITGDNKGLKKSFKDSENVIKASSTGMASMVGAAGKAMGAGFAVAAIGGAALNKIMGEAVDLANIQEKEERKLEAVLKATGNAAGFSAQELKNLASQYQSVTTTGDEVILSGMSILATFKNVKEEGFERATMAALDMSEVMGQSLNSSITQLGKALNDPIKGLSSLSRVGVTFTDQQKEQIKALQESGKMYEAQNIILEEMESQFGGVAKAMADLQGGSLKQLGNTWGDVLEKIGQTETQNHALTNSYKGLNTALEDQADNVAALFEGYGDAKAFFVDLLTGVVNMADDVRLMNIALIDGFVEGWISVKYGGKEAALTLTSAFGVAGDEILEAWADMLQGMSDSLDSMSFTITNPFGDDWNVGFEDATDAIDDHVVNLRRASTASEDYRAATALLVTEKDRELSIHNEVIDSMVDEVLGVNEVVRATEEAIEVTTQKGVVSERTAERSCDANQRQLTCAEEAMEDEREAAERLADDRATASRNMFADMSLSANDHFDTQVALLDSERAEYELLIEDKAAIDEWYTEKYKELEDEKLLKTGDFADGVKIAYDQMLEGQITWAEAGLNVFDTFTNEATSALSSNLFDIVHGDFDDLGDAWGSLWDSMLKAMVDIIAEMAVAWAAAKVADVASSFIFHDGTMYAGGDYNGQALLHDEIPAVLQMGEIVIPREQSERIRAALNGNTSIDQSTVSSTFDSVADALGADLSTQEGIDQTGGFLDGFFGNVVDEFGRDAVMGMAGVATGLDAGSIMDAITSSANIVSNITNAALNTTMSTMGLDPTAQTAGKIGGALAGLLGALSGPAAAAAALGLAVGVDGLMDLADMRDMESVKDQFQSARTKQAEKFGVPSAIAAVFGHFAGNVDFAEMEASMAAQAKSAANTMGVAKEKATAAGGEGSYGGGGYDLGGDVGQNDDGSSMGLGDGVGEMAARYGGIFSGPDQGYPVELHGTEAVIPLKNGTVPVDIRGADKEGAELLAKVERLIKAVENGNFAIARNTGRSADILDRWEYDGSPEVRQ